MSRLQVDHLFSVNMLNLNEIKCTYRCVWCGALFGQLSAHPIFSKLLVQVWMYLPVQFHLSMVAGSEIASEQSEEAGDRNSDAGGYFLE